MFSWDKLSPSASIRDMEQGLLDVCTKDEYGYYLWSYFYLTPSEWTRLCALQPPVHLLWKKRSKILWTAGTNTLVSYNTMANIEYLWQDLDAVKAYVTSLGRFAPGWLSSELQRREACWLTGLRRAWIGATVCQNE